MLKAQELRIGNYVDMCGIKEIHSIIKTTNGSFKLELNEKRSSGISVSEMCLIESLNLKPIKLTEDWLFDNDFYKFELDNGESYYQHYRFRINSNYAGFYFSRDLDIKYVHQLQNLYLDLTGEEFPINVA